MVIFQVATKGESYLKRMPPIPACEVAALPLLALSWFKLWQGRPAATPWLGKKTLWTGS